MLPVYKATAVDKQALLGGSTRPCLMTVENKDGNIIGNYVVKIFKHENINQYKPTNKEVYASILAKEFELNTPSPALIKVSNSLITDLKDSENYKDWDINSGIYFGSKLIENPSDFNKEKLKNLEQWEIETIFAFDVLIRNVDRREGKANMFLNDSEVFLIDHELSLNIKENQSFSKFLKMENGWKFIDGKEKGYKHLFLEYLRKKNKEEEINFDDFFEFLKTLNLKNLNKTANQLEELGFNTLDYYSIKPYLEEVKSNPSLFTQLLKRLIR